MDFWVEESDNGFSVPTKMKKVVRSKKIEFNSWGSKPLIEFLNSVGRDTSKQLSQYDVTAIINEYIKGNNLMHPIKKKRILCDEKLRSLFGRKTVARVSIYDLLEVHFAENNDESEDEDSSQDEDDINTVHKRQKVSKADGDDPSQKKLVESRKFCFAAIIPDNMKLVYLRRSLVQDLLKEPSSFEKKIVGSYVRIKSDPNDYSQKHSYQLLPVTGVKRLPGTVDTRDFFLQVPNIVKDVSICTLSNDSFSEEECKDLHERLKAGIQKRPTVGELEEKVQMLHADITKHWLVRELALLQNLIDQANEKGWRKELFDYMERKRLLQTPSEQEKLLLEVPNVIAEIVKPVVTASDPVEETNKGNDSPLTIPRGGLATCDSNSEANQALPTKNFGNGNASGQGAFVTSIQPEKRDQCMDVIEQQRLSNAVPNEFSEDAQLKSMEKNEICLPLLDEKLTGSHSSIKGVAECKVIELSDDDEEEEESSSAKPIFDHPESSIWYYVDPRGHVQGPFSMTALKRWSNLDCFPPNFKVWKKEQNQDEAVLLRDILRQMFPVD